MGGQLIKKSPQAAIKDETPLYLSRREKRGQRQKKSRPEKKGE